MQTDYYQWLRIVLQGQLSKMARNLENETTLVHPYSKKKSANKRLFIFFLFLFLLYDI